MGDIACLWRVGSIKGYMKWFRNWLGFGLCSAFFPPSGCWQPSTQAVSRTCALSSAAWLLKVPSRGHRGLIVLSRCSPGCSLLIFGLTLMFLPRSPCPTYGFVLHCFVCSRVLLPRAQHVADFFVFAPFHWWSAFRWGLCGSVYPVAFCN